ncbi:MAG: fibronectin type III domain-containing protein, partial [Oscillospiraceae bacterium]|nr:fibronectin type III domain-containing protein [Oscillospiraceae bacterium]
MRLTKWGKKTVALILALLMLFDQGTALIAPISAEEGTLPAQQVVQIQPDAPPDEQQEALSEPADTEPDTLPDEQQEISTDSVETEANTSPAAEENTYADIGESIGAGGEDLTLPAEPNVTIIPNTVRGTSAGTREIPTLSIPIVAGPLSSDSVEFAPTQCTLSVAIPAPGFYAIALSVPNDNEIEYLNIDSVLTDENGGAVAWPYFYIENSTYENWQTGEMVERHIKNVTAFFTAPSAGTYSLQINSVYNNGELPETIGAKCWQTVTAPRFDVVSEDEDYPELMITEPCYVFLTDIPEGCTAYYAFSSMKMQEGEGSEEYTEYNPSTGIYINKEAQIMAYCAKETAAGTLQSDTRTLRTWVDMENADCSVNQTANRVENGGYITFTTANPTDKVYYMITDGEWDQQRNFSEYIIQNGTLYTAPIQVNGEDDDYFEIFWATVTEGGMYTTWSTSSSFSIGAPPPASPVFTPDSSGTVTFAEPTEVTITSEPGTVLYYNINRAGETATESNTLTITVDRDMQIAARAYDAEKELYSEYTVTRYYRVEAEKALQLTQSAVIETDGVILLDQSGERYTLDVQEAGAYQFHVTYNSVYYASDYPVEIRDDADELVAELPKDGWGSVRDGIVTLAAGEYHLALLPDKNNSAYQHQPYQVTIQRGLAAPTISPAGGDYTDEIEITLTHPDSTADLYYRIGYGTSTLYTAPFRFSGYNTIYSWAQKGETVSDQSAAYYRVPVSAPTFSPADGWFTTLPTLTLSHASPNAEIYYRINSGDMVRYTGPITLETAGNVTAYAILNGYESATASASFRLDNSAPEYSNHYRFYVNSDLYNGYIYGSAELTGTVSLRASNIYDNDSGIDHVDYYLKVEDGAYQKIGTATWNEAITWDTTTVTGGASGSVAVRLAAIAYDKVGNAPITPDALDDSFDSDYYCPTFHVNNAPCAPMDTFTAEPQVGKIALAWSRETALSYGDAILIYRATSKEALAENPLTEEYYSYTEYEDTFLTSESAAGAYYYGIQIRDKRGILSDMVTTAAPVSPLPDTDAPTVHFGFDENKVFSNDNSIYVNSEDNVSLGLVEAVFIAENGTETAAEGSPWHYGETYANTYAYYYLSVAPLADGNYTLRVTSKDVYGNETVVSRAFIKDGTPPSAPTGLTASPLPGKIKLSWTAAPEADVVGYVVSCADSEDGYYYDAFYSPIAETNYIYPSYSYLTPGTNYWFKVVSVDRGGNRTESAVIMGTVGKYNPQLRLTQTPRLGEDVTVGFSGFQSGESVYFYLDREDTRRGYSYLDDGEIEETYTVGLDDNLRGTHTIRAVGQSSGLVATMRFTVSELVPTVTLSSTAVEEGGNVVATLTDFPSYRSVYFYLDPSASDSEVGKYFYPNEVNTKTLNLSDLGNPAPGNYVLRAVEPSSGLTAFANLTVTAAAVSLRCDTDNPTSGSSVSFYAAGLTADEAQLWLNGELVQTVSRSYYSAEHNFYNIRIPDLEPGESAVLATVIQPSTGKSASLRVVVSQPSATLTLSANTVGMEEFTVNGSGFKNEYVDLLIDGVKVRDAYFYGSGSITYRFAYGAQSGNHSVELRGQTSGRTAIGSITFADTVQSLSLSPETPALQSALTLLAAGFQPSEYVAFTMNGTALGSVWTSDGVASYTINSLEFVPTSGSYIFTAVGQSSGRVAFAGTNDNLILAYSGNIRGGSTLAVTVTGLDAGETVCVNYNNHTSDSVTANDSGAAEVRIAVPYGFEGNLLLTVWGQTSQRWGSATIPVTSYAPSFALSAATVMLGSSIKMTVSGFRPNAELLLLVDGILTDATLTLDGAGSGTLNYTLPLSGAVGTHTLGFFDPLSGATITKELTAQAPSFTLQVPSAAAPGDTITATISDLPTDETFTVTLDDNLPTEGTQFALPANMASGEHTVRFALTNSARIETATLTVAAPSAHVEAVQAAHEATLTLSASGFIPGETLSFYFDQRLINDSLSSCTALADGTISVPFALPATTLAGSHPLTVIGQTSYRSASTVVNIEETGPMISVSGLAAGSLAEGKPGDTLHFTGSNFTENGNYELYFESELLLSDVAADENGEIEGTFAVPSGFADGRYRIIANDVTTDEAAIAFIRVDTTAPAAPTVTVAPKKQSIVISWTAPADDDVAGYTVTGTPEGGEAKTIATVNSGVTVLSLDMSDSDFPLEPGKTYTFAVTAFDRLNNAGAAAVTPATALASGDDAPEVTSIYASGWHSIRVNGEWVTILTGESSVYAYAQDDQKLTKMTVAVAPEGGAFGAEQPVELKYSGNYSNLAHYSATLALDSSVYADGLYTFRFTATDSTGLTHSSERKFYVDNTPTAPVADLAVQESSNALIVSWSWTPGETGEVLDHYRVYYAADGEDEQYQNVPYSSGVKSCTIRRLTAGTRYTVRVTAVDVAGNESSWTQVFGTPFLDTEAPVITAVTPDDVRLGKDVTFYFEATDNAELDEYTVRAEINAGESGSFVPFGAMYYAGAVRAENLTYNGTYTIRFYISDLSGNESLPYETERTFDTTVAAVSGLTAESAAGGVRLSWNKVADNDLSYYYVYRAAADEDYRYWTSLSPLKVTSGAAASWTDYDVKDDVTYAYKVIAVDDVGNRQALADAMSAEAQKGSFVTSATVTPSENVKPGSILHISAQGFRGSEAIDAYLDGSDESVFWTYADENGIVSVDWSYVRNTTAGEHTLRLVGGRSGAFSSVSFTCQPTVLPAPTSLRTTAGTMEISLQWEGVEGASYYRVYRSEDGGEMTLVADRIYWCGYTDTALTMSGDSGKIYTYAVAAVDRYDFEGTRSDEAIDRPDADRVDPEITLFTSQRVGKMIRLFAEVSDDLRLGSVVFRYKPEGSGDDAYVTIAEIAIDGSRKQATVNTEFDTTDLADGSYLLYAQVTDRAGRVSSPLVRTLKLSSEKPLAPEQIKAQVGQMRITLSWQNAATQNIDVARYNVYRKSGSDSYAFLASTTLTTYTDTSAQSGVRYLYQITAVSEAEAESLPTALSDAVTPDADTAAPVISGFATPDGTRIAGAISIAPLATDNVGIDHIDFFLVNDDGSETKLGTSDKGSLTVQTTEYKKEGTLIFRVRVYDAAGNSSHADVHYQADNAAPVAPVLTATETELSVTLRWTLSATPKDLKGYRVYQIISGEYKLLAETANTYYQLQTKAEGSYCVTAVDDLGNESLYSNTETCAPGLDRTAPVIQDFAVPEIVRADAKLTLTAEDNGEIASYRISYRPLGSDELTGAIVPTGEWLLLAEGNWNALAEADGARVAAWDTLAVVSTEDGPEARFPDGLYELSLSLADAAGNRSQTETRVTVANNPPTAPEGFRVDAGEWRLIISWKPAAGNEAAGYTLYRKVNDGAYEVLTYTTANVYVDQHLDPNNQYFYMVAMENDLGKQGPTTEDYSSGLLPAGVKTRPEPETSLPVIMNMSPAQGSRFNAGLNLGLQVNDAVSLSTVEFWKAWIGSSSAATAPADAVYENFATLDVSDLQKELVESDTDILGTELFVINTTADTSAWADGAWAIKAVVRNMGAEPTVQIKTFFKDSLPPSQPELTVTDPMVGGTLNLAWTCSSADVAYYKVLRTASPDAELKDCELIAKPLSPAYTDIGLTNGTTYYYYIVVVDNAGNESTPSLRRSLAPTAVSDLGVYAVYTTPATPTAGRENTLRASLRNNGNAAANGTVSFYLGETLLGSTDVTLAANTGSEASITWLAPADLTEYIDITAKVETTPDTDANTENNTFTGSGIRVNRPPVAKIVLPTASADGTYDSGSVFSFGATGSHDDDGSIVRYRWDFGNGKRGDYATSPVTYTAPGRYTVTLTVTDDFGAIDTATEIITVGDCRPDLFVESVRWNPTDPEEGD